MIRTGLVAFALAVCSGTAGAQIISEYTYAGANGSTYVSREVSIVPRGSTEPIQLNLRLEQVGGDRLRYELEKQEPKTRAYHESLCRGRSDAQPITPAEMTPKVISSFGCKRTIPGADLSPSFTRPPAEAEKSRFVDQLSSGCSVTVNVGGEPVGSGLFRVAFQAMGYSDSDDYMDYGYGSIPDGCYVPGSAFVVGGTWSLVDQVNYCYIGSPYKVEATASLGGCSDSTVGFVL